MASISDSLGAITNVTSIITVNPQSFMSSPQNPNLLSYNASLYNVVNTYNVSLTIQDESQLYNVIASDLNVYQGQIQSGSSAIQYSFYQFQQNIINRLNVIKNMTYSDIPDEIVTDAYK